MTECGYLTVNEVATYLNVSPSTVKRKIRKGDIKAMFMGRWRIHKNDLNEYIDFCKEIQNQKMLGSYKKIPEITYEEEHALENFKKSKNILFGNQIYSKEEGSNVYC